MLSIIGLLLLCNGIESMKRKIEIDYINLDNNKKQKTQLNTDALDEKGIDLHFSCIDAPDIFQLRDSKSGYSVLELAIIKDRCDIVQKIMQRTSCLLQEEKAKILQMCVHYGSENVFEWLIKIGIYAPYKNDLLSIDTCRNFDWIKKYDDIIEKLDKDNEKCCLQNLSFDNKVIFSREYLSFKTDYFGNTILHTDDYYLLSLQLNCTLVGAIRHLLILGFNTCLKNKQGDTVVNFAIRYECLELLKLYIQFGGVLYKKNKRKKNSFSIAEDINTERILRFLNELKENASNVLIATKPIFSEYIARHLIEEGDITTLYALFKKNKYKDIKIKLLAYLKEFLIPPVFPAKTRPYREYDNRKLLSLGLSEIDFKNMDFKTYQKVICALTSFGVCYHEWNGSLVPLEHGEPFVYIKKIDRCKLSEDWFCDEYINIILKLLKVNEN